MNDRDIEDTREAPEGAEIDPDEMWDQINDILPKDLREFVNDTLEAEQDKTRFWRLQARETQKELDSLREFVGRLNNHA